VTSDRSHRATAARVLAFRVLLFALAAAAFAVAVGATRVRREGGAASTGPRYVCPMHAQITSATPGVCPICRMDLELVSAPGHGASFNASTYQTYDFVRRRGFGQEVHAPAWVEPSGAIVATVYADEARSLDPAAMGEFSLASSPETRIEVHVAAGPPVPWDRSTVRVRFDTAGARTAPPGAVGWVHMRGSQRPVEVIPSSAVLESNDGPYVLVAAKEGHSVTKRRIEIGRVIGGQAIVTSGLHVPERILVRSAFFVDAERRMRDEATVELPP